MLALYPAIRPNQTYQLNVDAPHTLYIEESGNPEGIPVLYIHFGPGGCSEPTHRRYFDPEIYRIILFDQRGCGQSTPHATTANNTTPLLLADIDAIRQFLQIDQWVMFGNSWGSLLSLLYAEKYPNHVSALILSSLFLGRQRDIDWFYKTGTCKIFPDYWADFLSPLSTAERQDIITAYHKRLTGNDDLLRRAATKAWTGWEIRCTRLEPQQRIIKHITEPFLSNSLAQIGCHYIAHQCFIEEDVVLRHIDKIAHIPGCLIHGRYDMVCPLACAFEINQIWPQSELKIVRDAGHSIREPAMVDALIHSTNEIGKRLSL